MKRFLNIFFFTLLTSIFLVACSRDEVAAPDFGYNYYPEQQGSFIVYDVDSFFYNDFTDQIDTFKFQLKEKTESFYNDNQNRKTARIERYVKIYNDTIPYSAMTWTLKDIWASNKTVSTAEKAEENVRYVKLAFPVKEEQLWNGNAQNTLDGWNYNYAFFDRPRTIGGVTFDSVLQVTQFDDKMNNLIKHQYYIELYARNKGLIYKKVIDIESQPGINPPPNFFQIPIMQRVTSGIQYIMTYNSSGIE